MANKLQYRKRNADQNQPLIVAALRACGASVVLLHDAGAGVPDLLVGYQGHTLLIEVKNPAIKGKLNARQIAWQADWLGSPVHVVFTAEEARDILEALRM